MPFLSALSLGPFRRLSLCLALVAFSGQFATSARGEQPPKVEEALLASAPKILQALRERGCQRLGVLKFRVRKGSGPVTDNAGTLNWLMAQRLETALILANKPDPQESLQVVRDASSVAAKARGASHLSAHGRSILFKQQYPLAWGKSSAKVDAFVTGLVQVAPDLQDMRIDILAIHQDSGELEALVGFQARTDGAILNELGESFQLRSVDGAGSAAEQARAVEARPAENFPLVNQPSVALKVYYDDRPVDLQFVGGEAIIPEPAEGQTVKMQLERMDDSDVILGAVLKVNGENTLFRQRERDLNCAKWVLKPNSQPTVLHGFQRDDNRAERFRVASPAESKPLEMHYGPEVGTISLVVFQAASHPQAGDLAAMAPELAAIAKAKFPDEPARDLESLQEALIQSAAEVSKRGVITQGAAVRHRIQMEQYDWDPEPIMSAVIRYYRPQN